MPTLLIVKALSSPSIAGLNPLCHFLVLLLLLFLVHLFTFFYSDLSEAK